MFQLLPLVTDRDTSSGAALAEHQDDSTLDTVDAQAAFCDLLQYLRRAAEAQAGLWQRVVVSAMLLRWF